MTLPGQRATRAPQKTNHHPGPFSGRRTGHPHLCPVAGKLLMPAEIRDIVAELQKSGREFQAAHPEAFHQYTVGPRMMAYVETGVTNAAPLVLFVHGSPGEWQGWVKYLTDPDLSARARLIAVDRPGFGGSGAGDAERVSGAAMPGYRTVAGSRVARTKGHFGGALFWRSRRLPSRDGSSGQSHRSHHPGRLD